LTWNEHNLLAKYAPLFQGPILEVGSHHQSKVPSPRELFDPSLEYFGIDMSDGPGVDAVHDMEYPLARTFKSVICCSVLEHTQRPWRVAQNIEASLESGGCLYVSTPFTWRFHGYPSDYWRISTEAYKILFPNVEWVILKYASKKKKEVTDTYGELTKLYKHRLRENAAVISLSIGFGIRK